jgi:hypothetical protein
VAGDPTSGPATRSRPPGPRLRTALPTPSARGLLRTHVDDSERGMSPTSRHSSTSRRPVSGVHDSGGNGVRDCGGAAVRGGKVAVERFHRSHLLRVGSLAMRTCGIQASAVMSATRSVNGLPR